MRTLPLKSISQIARSFHALTFALGLVAGVAAALGVSGCVSGRTLTEGFQIELDPSTAQAVLRTVESGAALPPSFERFPGTRLLVVKAAARDATVTPESFVAAVERCGARSCEDGPALRLASTQARTAELRVLLDELVKGSAQHATRITKQVSAHVPHGSASGTVFPIHLVLGGRSDGYVEELDGQLRMAIDIRTVLQGSAEDSLRQFRALADHEAWHVAFLAHTKAAWSTSEPAKVQDPAYALIFALLNEGYGHYMSFLAYKDTDVAARDFLRQRDAALKESSFLRLFATEMARFEKAERADRLRLVDESHLSDKMWNKWGALTGALMIADLRTERGPDAVMALLERDPFAFIEAHAALGAAASFRHPPELARLVAEAKRAVK